MTHLLITGRPGVGKTTLIRELTRRLSASRPAGFYTLEIRQHGARKGFRLVTLDGRQRVLAHVDHPGTERVGRYRVDVAGFEQLLAALDLPHSPSRVIVLDEIGKMECLSTQFINEVTLLLDSSRTVIATVALTGGGFIRQVKERPDCRLVTVTVHNREQLAGMLLTEIRQGLGLA